MIELMESALSAALSALAPDAAHAFLDALEANQPGLDLSRFRDIAKEMDDARSSAVARGNR